MACVTVQIHEQQVLTYHLSQTLFYDIEVFDRSPAFGQVTLVPTGMVRVFGMNVSSAILTVCSACCDGTASVGRPASATRVTAVRRRTIPIRRMHDIRTSFEQRSTPNGVCRRRRVATRQCAGGRIREGTSALHPPVLPPVVSNTAGGVGTTSIRPGVKPRPGAAQRDLGAATYD